jgi:hypothetical protein
MYFTPKASEKINRKIFKLYTTDENNENVH